MDNLKNLFLTLQKDKIYKFYPLLQQGFRIKIQTGLSIKTMLCEQCGISSEYIENQIKTVFLDGKPVDDIDSAKIKDGSVLALSSAMPGLVGTTFRRGGHLSSFRSTITHWEGKTENCAKQGLVMIKLFNLLINELGLIFLTQGILVKGDKAEDFIKSQPSDLFKKIIIDKTEISYEALLSRNCFDKNEFVRVVVNII